MPIDTMRWTREALNSVPHDVLRDMTRYIEEGDIHACTWFVRYMLQCDFEKVATCGSAQDMELIGVTYRAMLREIPQGCYGSREATLRWPGLRNIK